MDSPDATATREWYERYAARRPNRNDWRHPGVQNQVLARDLSVARALAAHNVGLDSRILDVGCGDGGSLAFLLRLGFHSDNLTGVDILPELIASGKKRLPGLTLEYGDGRNLRFQDAEFDVVMESTMFIQLSDDDALAIAAEMMRLAHSHIVITDWRYGWGEYHAVTKRRLRRLFPGYSMRRFAGALVPPLGRRLPPGAYYPLRAARPLVGMYTTVLSQPDREVSTTATRTDRASSATGSPPD